MKPQLVIEDEDLLVDIADLFKIFSDSTRIRILYFLSSSERNVNEIAEGLNMNQSAISHQLKTLKNNKLIKNRREGNSIYYSLADDHVYRIITQGLQHVQE